MAGRRDRSIRAGSQEYGGACCGARSEIPKWWFAFQSQGASGGPWIGPTVEETLTAIASDGVKVLLLQPIGFLCDHVEILYDVDIAFKEYASKLGIRLERPESLNASPILARALAGLAKQGLTRLERTSPLSPELNTGLKSHRVSSVLNVFICDNVLSHATKGL